MKKLCILSVDNDFKQNYKSINYNELTEFLNKNNITEIYNEKTKKGYHKKLIFIANNELILLSIDSAWNRIFIEVIERELILAKVLPEKKENKEFQSPITFMQ
ncbi:MAG: hypothetical protein M0R17_03295 [Candidatus Omnitrophica bacterium]|jgi:hypothetical protein|nr:hypothetical protein [Candidatus Omnitrophota bacterium]